MTAAVFPTTVGVFLSPKAAALYLASLPHDRGGVSVYLHPCERGTWSSPRPWGCFRLPLDMVQIMWVFPTTVGVFPPAHVHHIRTGSLPHDRGGVSAHRCHQPAKTQSSPRPWGCFHLSTQQKAYSKVFPTTVGVFPTLPISTCWGSSLPHDRGGVSIRFFFWTVLFLSSPRPWGCF